jgi:hypothetical protein
VNKVKSLQEGDIMNKSYLIALLTLTCLLGLRISAGAQSVDGVVVTVPFEFVAGGATLPAGEYRINRVNPAPDRELAIGGYGKGSAFLLPEGFDHGPSDQPTLSFVNVGGRYFLSKVKTLGGVYTMPLPPATIALAQAKGQSTLSSSGTN